MASNQYFEEPVPQVDSFEDKSSLEMWKCGGDDAIEDSDKNGSGGFDCNICLDCVQDPVVTLCGHLYCWPCIYKWLNFYSISSDYEEKEEPICPVCKSEISQSSLVPLYGREGQTTSPSKSKAQQVGIAIPPRPLVPSWVAELSRSSQPTSQAHHHPHYPHHPQQFNSISGSYTSPMLNTGGSQTAYGVIGEMIYARVFGNQVTNIYTYPNSYDHSRISSNPRIRRHLMQADKSLSRICFFLLCCAVLCLLLF